MEGNVRNVGRTERRKDYGTRLEREGRKGNSGEKVRKEGKRLEKRKGRNEKLEKGGRKRKGREKVRKEERKEGGNEGKVRKRN